MLGTSTLVEDAERATHRAESPSDSVFVFPFKRSAVQNEEVALQDLSTTSPVSGLVQYAAVICGEGEQEGMIAAGARAVAAFRSSFGFSFGCFHFGICVVPDWLPSMKRCFQPFFMICYSFPSLKELAQTSKSCVTFLCPRCLQFGYPDQAGKTSELSPD